MQVQRGRRTISTYTSVWTSWPHGLSGVMDSPFCCLDPSCVLQNDANASLFHWLGSLTGPTLSRSPLSNPKEVSEKSQKLEDGRCGFFLKVIWVGFQSSRYFSLTYSLALQTHNLHLRRRIRFLR